MNGRECRCEDPVYGAAVGDELTIRAVTEDDVEALFGLILELASYEKLSDEVNGDAEVLRRSLFVEGTAEALLAELGGEAVGYAILCGTFSSFECKGGIWIEDIFVRPESREAGVGRALFARVAALAVERGFPRVEWAALNWNELALGFYDRLGARRMDEWQMLRLEGEALRALGSARLSASSVSSARQSSREARVEQLAAGAQQRFQGADAGDLGQHHVAVVDLAEHALQLLGAPRRAASASGPKQPPVISST